MIDAIGWMGALLFATCGLPQLIKSLRNTASTKGLSILFLCAWLVGEILTLTYAIFKAPRLPLLLNYSFNILIVSTMILIYCVYRNKENQDLLKTIITNNYFIAEMNFLSSEPFAYALCAFLVII